jgi:hypothetical protein
MRYVIIFALMFSYMWVDFGDGSWIERFMVRDDSGYVISCIRFYGPGPGGACTACAYPELLACPCEQTPADNPTEPLYLLAM